MTDYILIPTHKIEKERGPNHLFCTLDSDQNVMNQVQFKNLKCPNLKKEMIS